MLLWCPVFLYGDVIILCSLPGAALLSEEALHQFSPSAAAASKLLKSGMTLTQVYNEYVKVTDKLMSEEEENKRLRQCLESIMEV